MKLKGGRLRELGGDSTLVSGLQTPVTSGTNPLGLTFRMCARRDLTQRDGR